MGDGAVEADAVARPEPVHRVAQVDLGHALEHEPALLGGVREGLFPRPGADLVLAQDELDVPGEIGSQQLVGDAAAGGEPLALAGPHHRPVERARLGHEAADGGVEGGGDRLEGGDGGIELIALELAQRAHAYPDLLGDPAQGQAARQPRAADTLPEAGRARHGRTLSSSTVKVK